MTRPNSTSLARLIEMNLAELFDFSSAWQDDPLLEYYSRVLIAYLRSDRADLRLRLGELDSLAFPEHALLSALVSTRIGIRERRIDSQILQRLVELSAQSSIWEGEGFFVSAMAYEVMEENSKSKEYYRRAAAALDRNGSHRKALTARLNRVVAVSRQNPERKMILEYQHLASQARRLREPGISGVCYLNISREYHRMGAAASALRHAHKALVSLRSDRGCLQYDLALVHRAQLFMESDRVHEARFDLEEARLSTHVEVQAALASLDVFASSTPSTSQLEDLTPTWRERVIDSKKKIQPAPAKLGPMEESLLRHISKSPRSKFEIIEFLFGVQIDFEAAENRLKNLLGRLRRKRPDLIVFENGRYRISDEVFLDLETA